MNWVKRWLSTILYREDRILAEVAKIEARLQSSGQPQISDKLDIIIANQERIYAKMSQMDDEVTALTTSVAALTSADDSLIALVNGIGGLISAAVADALAKGATPAQLKSVTDLDAAVKAQTAKAVAAVTANTPTPPAPAPAPGP
jgi:hypothetical protein